MVFKSANISCDVFIQKSYVARWWCDSFRVRYKSFVVKFLLAQKFSEDPLTGKRSFRFNVQADVVFYPAAAVFGNSSFLSPTLHTSSLFPWRAHFTLYNERFKGIGSQETNRETTSYSHGKALTNHQRIPFSIVVIRCVILEHALFQLTRKSLTNEGILSSHIPFIHTITCFLCSLKSIESCLILSWSSQRESQDRKDD